MAEELYLKAVDFDGCAVGLVSTTGEPLLKPWRIMTDNQQVIENLYGFRCDHSQTHGRIEGKETAKTASYPGGLCILLHHGITNGKALSAMPARIPTITAHVAK
eukprot:8936450-Heterocapsa_arctica.AAC.1